MPDLRAEDGSHWTLFAREAPSQTGRMRTGAPGPDTGRTIHASSNLERGVLKVLVNSKARAARDRDVRYQALANVVREPLVERVTPEQAMAEVGMAGTPITPGVPDGVDPAAPHTALHLVLDHKYRYTLSEPVPMLGGTTLMK